MDLASKPCYPITPEQYYAVDEHPEVTGLTFRERLIISLASNSSIIYWVEGTKNKGETFEKFVEPNLTAQAILTQADAIINQLTKE